MRPVVVHNTLMEMRQCWLHGPLLLVLGMHAGCGVKAGKARGLRLEIRTLESELLNKEIKLVMRRISMGGCISQQCLMCSCYVEWRTGQTNKYELQIDQQTIHQAL